MLYIVAYIHIFKKWNKALKWFTREASPEIQVFWLKDFPWWINCHPQEHRLAFCGWGPNAIPRTAIVFWNFEESPGYFGSRNPWRLLMCSPFSRYIFTYVFHWPHANIWFSTGSVNDKTMLEKYGVSWCILKPNIVLFCARVIYLPFFYWRCSVFLITISSYQSPPTQRKKNDWLFWTEAHGAIACSNGRRVKHIKNFALENILF